MVGVVAARSQRATEVETAGCDGSGGEEVEGVKEACGGYAR